MDNQFINTGEVAIIDSTTIEISELPVKTWTQVSHRGVVPSCMLMLLLTLIIPFARILNFTRLSLVQVYKENVLEPMLNGTEKVPPLITDYKEYHTDTTVRFIVKMATEKLSEAEAAGLHKVFKLQQTVTCNSMVTAATHTSRTNAGGREDGSRLTIFVLFVRFCLTTWAA